MPFSQTPDQLIDVANWATDELVYPEGSRPKATFTSPPVPPFIFVRPKHRYLFKQSAERYPAQFWAEVMAYRIGTFVGVPVPPSFVSFDSNRSVYGALIEWFYSDSVSSYSFDRYVSGGQYMRRMIPGYDIVRGEQHNFESVHELCRGFSIAGHLVDAPLTYWAKVLLFDALIGNQDRHQDNWGILWRVSRSSVKRMEGRFAPAFDNGTSLGHEITEENLTKAIQADSLNRYIRRGRHHMRWALSDTQSVGHSDMIARLVEKYPKTRQYMSSLLSYDPEDMEAELGDLVAFPVPAPYALSADRLRWVFALLRARREHLLTVLS